jgi:glyoxylase-like metal-dependent hydrolase (beta-lactamase superfamily II)
VRIAESCYAVTGLGYSTPWCVNAGFVVGQETTLVVDTGANTLAAQTLFGYATAVPPANRFLAINSEKHFDHTGGNAFFLDRGVDVWGHERIVRTAEEFAAEVAEFNGGILNPVRK